MILEYMSSGIHSRIVLKGVNDILEVKFYDTVDDVFLKFAVIISRSRGMGILQA